MELASNDNEPVSVDEHGNIEHFKEIKLELPVCHSGISDDASENVFTAEVTFSFCKSYHLTLMISQLSLKPSVDASPGDLITITPSVLIEQDGSWVEVKFY